MIVVAGAPEGPQLLLLMTLSPPPPPLCVTIKVALAGVINAANAPPKMSLLIRNMTLTFLFEPSPIWIRPERNIFSCATHHKARQVVKLVGLCLRTGRFVSG